MKSQKQSKKAFSELIEKNQRIIHKITLVYTNNSADREDLFQEICLQLWKSHPNFRNESKFSTWVYRIALNTAINDIRKNKNKPAFEQLRDYPIQTDSTSEEENIKLMLNIISKLNCTHVVG